jgi:hypothetical protein
MRRKTLAGWLGWAVLTATAGLAQITETPDTVAPGRFLLRMDALSLTVNHDASTRYAANGVASTFLTTGLTSTLDAQVGAEVFIDQRFDSGGLHDRRTGIGDLYFRTKWKFYEDKASGTAVALLPFVKLPTSTGGVGKKAMEGGLILPWKTELLGGVSMTAMAELDFLRNDADNGYDSFWFVSTALHRQVTKALGFYGEFTLGKSSGGAPGEGKLGGGATFAVSDSVSWDYAIYRSFTSGTSDWKHVLRLNWGF